jgi:hypothetical protein
MICKKHIVSFMGRTRKRVPIQFKARKCKPQYKRVAKRG